MRALLATLTLAAAVAQPAAAAEPSTYEGGCAFESIAQETVTGNDYQGVAYAAVFVHSPSGEPVSATVTCEVTVNGVPQSTGTVSGSGTGLVVAAGPITFGAAWENDVGLCETVDFTSDDTPTVRHCDSPEPTRLPPGNYPSLSTIFDVVNPLLAEHVEPAVCEATGGDLYVADMLVWDCAPFEPF